MFSLIDENTSNISSKENSKNDCEIVNFYVDANGILRNFWGYEIFHKNKYVAFLIDRTNKYIHFLNDNNEYILVDENYKILFQISFTNTILTNPYVENIQNPLLSNICHTLNGDIYFTNGGMGGLFRGKVNRDSDNNIISVDIDQFPYNQILENGKLKYLRQPTFVEYFDNKIIVVDKALGRFYSINAPFANTQTIVPEIDTDDATDNVGLIVEFNIQSIPCDVVNIKRIERTLCVIGTECVEFYKSDATLSGLTRINNSIIESGTIFPNSVCVINGKLVFLGSNSNSSPEVTIIDLSKQQAIVMNKNGLSLHFEDESFENFNLVVGYNFSPSQQDFYIINCKDKTFLVNVENMNYFTITGKKRNSNFPAYNIYRFNNKWNFISNDGVAELNYKISSYDGFEIPLSYQTAIIRNPNSQLETFGLDNVELGLRPIRYDFNNDDHIEVFLQFNILSYSNDEFSKPIQIMNIGKDIFAKYCGSSELPRGKKIMQLRFIFSQNKDNKQFYPICIENFNLNLS